MISLELFGIILSFMTICSTSNLRNGLEAQNPHALSSLNPSGDQIDERHLNPMTSLENISNDPKKSYENWLLSARNPLPENHFPQKSDQNKDIENFNGKQYFNDREPSSLNEDRVILNRELKPHFVVEKRFEDIVNRDFKSYDSINMNNNREEVHVNNAPNMNEYLYNPETPAVNQYNRVVSQPEPILEKTILREQELGKVDLLRKNPVRNLESFYQRDIPNENEIRNIGLQKSEQIFSSKTRNNQHETAYLPKHLIYEHHKILNDPVIQNILQTVKPTKRYLVINPNGTVEHMNDIQAIVKKHPNNVIVNYPINKEILDSAKEPSVTNNDQVSNIYASPKLDTVVQYKVDNSKDFNQYINTEQKEKTSAYNKTPELSVLPRTLTQDGADHYKSQPTQLIDTIDIKNNVDKQLASVLTSNENSSNETTTTETITMVKKQATLSTLMKTDDKNKTIDSVPSTSFQDVIDGYNDNGNELIKNVSATSTVSSTVNNEYDNSSSKELSTEVQNSNLAKEDTNTSDESSDIGSEKEKNNSTTQKNIESSQTNSKETLVNDKNLDSVKNDKTGEFKEETVPAEKDDKWKRITMPQGQVDVLYLLNAPIVPVKILDGEGKPHECLQIGESTLSLSYLICSVEI